MDLTDWLHHAPSRLGVTLRLCHSLPTPVIILLTHITHNGCEVAPLVVLICILLMKEDVGFLCMQGYASTHIQQPDITVWSLGQDPWGAGAPIQTQPCLQRGADV